MGFLYWNENIYFISLWCEGMETLYEFKWIRNEMPECVDGITENYRNKHFETYKCTLSFVAHTI